MREAFDLRDRIGLLLTIVKLEALCFAKVW